MNNKWCIVLNIRTKECMRAEGVETEKGWRSTLYLWGNALDTGMKKLEAGDVRKRLTKDISSLQRFNGRFGGVLSAADTLYVFCDRPTTAKVYFTVCNEMLYAADSPDRVAELCPRVPEMNLTAWSEMLKWGGLLHHHTFYKDIFSIRVGEVVQVDRKTGAFDWLRYDTVWNSGIVSDLPLDRFAANLADKLQENISLAYRHHSQQMAATLTGGLDSRILVGLLKKAGIAVPLITTNTDGIHNECRIVDPLLEYWGWSSEKYQFDDGYYPRYAKACLDAAGYECILHTWFMAAALGNADKDRYFMMGLGGGELLRYNNGVENQLQSISMFHSSQADALVDSLFENAYKMTSEILSGDAKDEFHTLFQKSLEKSVDPFLDQPRGAMDWFLANKFFNSGTYIMQIYGDAYRGFSPYLTSDALSLLLTLDQNAAQGDLYPLIYQKIDPKLYDFPSTRTTQDPALCMPSMLHNRKVASWMEEELLGGPLVSGGYVTQETIRKYFANMYKRDNYYLYNIRTCLAMHYWLQRFVQIEKNKILR